MTSARVLLADEVLTRRALAIVVLATALAVPVARVDGGPVICPVRLATGRPCPACGLTRSTVRTVHGDLGGAVRAHPAGPAVVALLAAWAVTGRRHTGTVLDPRSWRTRPRLRPVTAVVAAVWAVWALVRFLDLL